jgi:hypothetical protein
VVYFDKFGYKGSANDYDREKSVRQGRLKERNTGIKPIEDMYVRT